MSHIVVIKTKIYDAAALTAACRRLGLAEPVHGNVRFFNNKTPLEQRLSSRYCDLQFAISPTPVHRTELGAWHIAAQTNAVELLQEPGLSACDKSR